MRKIGEAPWTLASYNTCQCGGRIFRFSQEGGVLIASEVVLGETAAFAAVNTGIECKATNNADIACCPLGDRILVMAGSAGHIFAALLGIGAGRLSSSNYEVVELSVVGDRNWQPKPFLGQLSDSHALLYFTWQSGMWRCEAKDTTLTMKRLASDMPAQYGFITAPLRLPDGKLLMVGSLPYYADITIISMDGKPTFQKVSNVPGAMACYASTVLIDRRFVVGFGGTDRGRHDDLWVLDIETGMKSPVRKQGDWHPKDYWTPLVIRDGVLYLLGGQVGNSMNCIPLASLASLILNAKLRHAFCASLGLPLYLSKAPMKKLLNGCFAGRL